MVLEVQLRHRLCRDQVKEQRASAESPMFAPLCSKLRPVGTMTFFHQISAKITRNACFGLPVPDGLLGHTAEFVLCHRSSIQTLPTSKVVGRNSDSLACLMHTIFDDV